MPPNSFGRYLRQRRKMLDMSCEELAGRIGCTASTLYKIEADERRPSKQLAELLAKHLHISPEKHASFVRFARAEHAKEAPLWGASFQSETNLPTRPTALVGRERDASVICKRLLQHESRLLTLVGPPGIGKTQLALQVATQAISDFADGVFFVALAPISDAALVSTTIANTLGLPDTGPRPPLQRLMAFLRDKQILLLLDNFEQILSAAAEVAELLSACPLLKLVITSRAPLRIRQEQQIPVLPLSIPDLTALPDTALIAQATAVTLFVERAASVMPDFVLTDENAGTIAAICARLDGLPLAIELISARVKLLPPTALLDRLSGRLLLQSDGLRDIEPRHRTLNAAIAWSYQLLNADEQTLFRHLSIFVSGWTFEAAERICMGNLSITILDGLSSLLDKSLIKQEVMPGGEPRFLMLETIREYALEQLLTSGELPLLQQQHAIYFLALAETHSPSQPERQMKQWWDHLEIEHANLRAALIWSQTQASDETGLRLMIALVDFWRLHGHLKEGSIWFAKLLAQQKEDVARLQTKQSRTLRAIALDWLGLFNLWQGELDAAQSHYEVSLALFRELGDKAWSARVLSDLGMLFQTRGEYKPANELLKESLELFRDLGSAVGVPMCLFFLGTLAYSQGNIQQADMLFQESLAQFRTSNYLWMIASVLANLAMIQLDQGSDEQAETYLIESLVLLRQMDEKWQIVHTLEVFARLAVEQAEFSNNTRELLRSARIFGACEHLRETHDAQRMEFQRRSHEQAIAKLDTQLDKKTFVESWSEGRAMTLNQAVAYALNEIDIPPETTPY